jgi:DNA polymerase-3 subunit epsilon
VIRHPDPRKYNAAILTAKQYLSQPAHWVILDTETTGLAKTDEVIQVAVMAANGDTVFDSYIRPKSGRIPYGSTRVHGITIDMVEDAPDFSEVAAALMAILENKTILAYNASFDDRMLRQTAQLYGGEFVGSFDCVMKLYSTYVGIPSAYGSGFRNVKLPGARHTAIEDCRATLDVLEEMANAQPLLAARAETVL